MFLNEFITKELSLFGLNSFFTQSNQGMSSYSFLERLIFPPTWYSKHKLKQRLAQKTVLITGASYGIGEQTAYLLATPNRRFILVARTTEKLEKVKEKIEKKGAKALVFAADLSQKEQVTKLLKQLEREPIDLVVSNAGKSIMRPIQQSLDRFHDFERTMNLNYFAPVQLILGLIPMLEKRQGQFINISAVNVLLAPAPYWAAYQASKSAFDQWFRCVGLELEASGIKHTSIYFPLVRTGMIAPNKTYQNAPAMQPKHAAQWIAKAICNQHKKVAPWWLIFGQLGSILFRIPWEWVASRFVKHRKK